jgi:hypothetical protein
VTERPKNVNVEKASKETFAMLSMNQRVVLKHLPYVIPMEETVQITNVSVKKATPAKNVKSVYSNV